jgi:hypothetical protein
MAISTGPESAHRLRASQADVMAAGKPVYIQIPKSQLWRTIICSLGQKG